MTSSPEDVEPKEAAAVAASEAAGTGTAITESPSTTAPTLKTLALRGSLWTIGGHGASQVLRFANNIILNRLVASPLLGLMATVNVIITGLHLITDVGIGTSIIQSKRGDDPRFYDTAWTIHVIRGFVLWLVTFLIAWPVYQIYAEQKYSERLMWLLPLVGVSAVIGGFNSTALHTLNRRLHLGKLTLIDFAAQATGMAVGIAWALIDPSLACLVAAYLAGVMVRTVASHRLGVRNRFHWDKEAAAHLMHFGRWVLISTMLTYGVTQLDRLLIGVIAGFDFVNIYSIALMLAMAIPEVVGKLGGSVIFPLLSELVRRDDGTLYRRLLRVRRAVILSSTAGLLVLAVAGEHVVYLLYKPELHASGWMLKVIAAGAIAGVVSTSTWYAFFALGHLATAVRLQVVKLVLMVAAIGVGNALGDMVGVIAGIASVELLHYPFVAWALHRRRLWQPELDLPVLACGYAAAAAALWFTLPAAMQ